MHRHHPEYRRPEPDLLVKHPEVITWGLRSAILTLAGITTHETTQGRSENALAAAFAAAFFGACEAGRMIGRRREQKLATFLSDAEINDSESR